METKTRERRRKRFMSRSCFVCCCACFPWVINNGMYMMSTKMIYFTNRVSYQCIPNILNTLKHSTWLIHILIFCTPHILFLWLNRGGHVTQEITATQRVPPRSGGRKMTNIPRKTVISVRGAVQNLKDTRQLNCHFTKESTESAPNPPT